MDVRQRDHRSDERLMGLRRSEPARLGLVSPGFVSPGLVSPGLVSPGLVSPGLSGFSTEVTGRKLQSPHFMHAHTHMQTHTHTRTRVSLNTYRSSASQALGCVVEGFDTVRIWTGETRLTGSEFTWTLHSLLPPHPFSSLTLLKSPLLHTYCVLYVLAPKNNT